MENIEIIIDRIAYGGAGVGRLPNGKVCFVHGTAPGETVLVTLTDEKKGFANAKLVEVLKSSPERIPVKCPIPGAPFQHLSYQAENQFKNAQLKDFFMRNVPAMCRGGVFSEPLIPPKELGYRNKITLHAQQQEDIMALGYFMEDNHTVQDISCCPLADEAVSERLTQLRADEAFMNSLLNGDSVTIRHADNGVFHWKNQDYAGLPLLEFSTPAGILKTAAESFFQVNQEGAALLQDTIKSVLASLPEPPTAFLDLYCGSGFFSIAAAEVGIVKIAGADIDPRATANAAENLKNNGFNNARFYSFPADRIVNRLIKKGGNFPLLLLDPPRTGLDKATCQSIALDQTVINMIYVSCAPDTLARDLKVFADAGFKMISTVMLNMFPRTAHLESITLLQRS